MGFNSVFKGLNLNIPERFFEKCLYIKFRYDPSSGSRAVPCRRTDQPDVTKLIAAVRSFTDAPNYVSHRSTDLTTGTVHNYQFITAVSLPRSCYTIPKCILQYKPSLVAQWLWIGTYGAATVTSVLSLCTSHSYRGPAKSLARPTSQCILLDG